MLSPAHLVAGLAAVGVTLAIALTPTASSSHHHRSHVAAHHAVPRGPVAMDVAQR